MKNITKHILLTLIAAGSMTTVSIDLHANNSSSVMSIFHDSHTAQAALTATLLVGASYFAKACYLRYNDRQETNQLHRHILDKEELEVINFIDENNSENDINHDNPVQRRKLNLTALTKEDLRGRTPLLHALESRKYTVADKLLGMFFKNIEKGTSITSYVSNILNDKEIKEKYQLGSSVAETKNENAQTEKAYKQIYAELERWDQEQSKSFFLKHWLACTIFLLWSATWIANR